jgi:YfiH family protein
MTSVKPVISSDLSHSSIQHGFFTREGGVSGGIYKGLNVGLGSNDTRNDVIENRTRVAGFFNHSEQELVSPYQVHSNDVLEVSKPWQSGERPKVDGLVSKTSGIAIGILTADCGPVLFADTQNHVVGACHAGWKGATGGVLENTISAMENIGAKRDSITAILGPTISVQNYEVGPEFVERLTQLDAANTRYLQPSKRDDHAMFDLPHYIVDRLKTAGVNAGWSGQCTYADEERFFSYRRTTHRKEPDYGRQISAISIRD